MEMIQGLKTDYDKQMNAMRLEMSQMRNLVGIPPGAPGASMYPYTIPTNHLVPGLPSRVHPQMSQQDNTQGTGILMNPVQQGVPALLRSYY